jgi:PAS domain S-box-containing protein
VSDADPDDGAFVAAVDGTPGTVYRRREDGAHPLISASDGCAALTGYDAAALDGAERGWLDVVHPTDRDDVREAVRTATSGDRHDERYRIRTADGDVRWVRDRFTAADADGVVEGVALDVTDHVDDERSIDENYVDESGDTHASGERAVGGSDARNDRNAAPEPYRDPSELLEALFDHIPIHAYVKDTEGRHVLLTDALDQADERIGKRDIDLEMVDDEQARRAYEADMRVIRDEEPMIENEEHLVEAGHWNLTSKVPLYDDDEVIGLVGVSRRITEQKRAEQELRRQTERLEEFADVLSHDIRNPLNIAKGYVDLAREADDPDAHLDAVAEAVERADDIVEDVLALCRHDELELDVQSVSLADVVKHAWRSVTTLNATVVPPESDCYLRADRSQLSRVLENLFRNAVQHGSDDVTVAVETTDSGFAVEDDGPGIPESEREQVFETNYTTHEDGTGYGLSIVAEVADAHGWAVTVAEGSAGGGERPDGSRSSEDERTESSGARFEFTGVGMEAPPEP